MNEALKCFNCFKTCFLFKHLFSYLCQVIRQKRTDQCYENTNVLLRDLHLKSMLFKFIVYMLFFVDFSVKGQSTWNFKKREFPISWVSADVQFSTVLLTAGFSLRESTLLGQDIADNIGNAAMAASYSLWEVWQVNPSFPNWDIQEHKPNDLCGTSGGCYIIQYSSEYHSYP